jgi:hypothetical protein
VKVIIGGHEFITEEGKTFQKKNYNRFNQRFEMDVEEPYMDLEQFGDVIILLMEDKHPVCYYKDTIKNYMRPDASYKWISFKPDLCVNRCKDINEAGMLSFKLSMVEGKDSDIIEMEKQELSR